MPRCWGLATPGMWPWERLEVQGGIPHHLLGIGQEANGELYALTSDALGPTGTSGKVFRIAQADRR